MGAFAQSWLVSRGISPAFSFALVLGFSLFRLRRILSWRLKGQGFLLFSYCIFLIIARIPSPKRSELPIRLYSPTLYPSPEKPPLRDPLDAPISYGEISFLLIDVNLPFRLLRSAPFTQELSATD